ncbi:protein of unknown function [Taphrina deformans PYCC 5710]|uniref:Uncharacterized protein n=1 Tax=Taphrina deformans (strain PYCC 5710 / ATCC 11124 / CBS 356.35 / IMI 108563 / JCM 9778 / NBRC 8474) TaxID=1097556 RepID=R4XDT7_TAPDE|nr:protein of unknown function [Taphrina deformans PYCC 5710]|eukprot:CCG83797.1 protein of unknown function [Taphrina deformans PYCC 5710]
MDASSSSTSTLSSTESVTASTTSAFVLTYTSSSTSSSASQPVATCIEPGTSDYYIHATAIDGIKFLNYQYTQGFFTSFSTGSADPRLIVRPANFDPVTCRFSLYMLNQPSYSNAQYLGFITDYDNVDNKNDMLANSYNHVQLGGSNTNAGSAQGFAYQNSRNMADEGPGLTSESGVWSLVDSATNTLQVNWINVSGEIVTLPTYKNEYGDVKGIRDISTYSAHYTSETNIAILFSLVRVQ